MKTWKVQVESDPQILTLLLPAFNDPDIHLIADPNSSHNAILESQRFNLLTASGDVFNLAEMFIQRMRAMCALQGIDHPYIRVAAVFECDTSGQGKGSANLPFAFQVLPTKLAQFNVSSLPHGNAIVDAVIGICADRDLTWAELYKLWEYVVSDLGNRWENWVTQKGVSKQRIKLFKHTANSQPAIGIDARHGPLNQEPPKTPMLLQDARAMITSLCIQWLSEKTSPTR